MATTAFRGMKPFPQFMFALFIAGSSLIILSIIATIIVIPFFGLDKIIISLSPGAFDNPENINFLKYFQVVQSIGFFIVPSFILAFLYDGNIKDYLQINKTTQWQSYFFAMLCIVVAIPLINFLGAINGQMKLPEFLSGLEHKMKNWEEAAKIATEKFLNVKSLWSLSFNLFMIAVLPALGEEFLFRGIVQRLFTKIAKNHHWGIWIAAFIFSALHMQFYGFLPRMALGAMFGYLLIWTGTMWVPILAHFVNNAMGVMGYYLINKGVISKDVEEWGTGTEQLPLVIFSMVTVGFLLFLIYRNEQEKRKMPANQ